MKVGGFTCHALLGLNKKHPLLGLRPGGIDLMCVALTRSNRASVGTPVTLADSLIATDREILLHPALVRGAAILS